MYAEQRRELANPAIRDGLVMVTGERYTISSFEHERSASYELFSLLSAGASDLHARPLLTFDTRALLVQLRRAREGQCAGAAVAGNAGDEQHAAQEQHVSATVADALADALDYVTRLVPFARRAHGFAALADLSRLAHEPKEKKEKEKHKSHGAAGARPRRQESALDTLQSVFSLLLSALDSFEVRKHNVLCLTCMLSYECLRVLQKYRWLNRHCRIHAECPPAHQYSPVKRSE